jgi:predicted amidohydrolase
MTLTVALLSETFWGPDAGTRLDTRMREAARRGASLAVLPELPLDSWVPRLRQPRDEDAEAPGGRRWQMLAGAARQAGIGLVGGAIVRDPATGDRFNTALVFDAKGLLVASYRKLHLPEEPGFWETSHYRPGTSPPARIDAFDMPLGVQICSDANRPEGSHLLAAQGAEAIVIPRATESGTWERWKLVLRASALTGAVYVLSVNRQDPDLDCPLGGPSAVLDPNGHVVLESFDPLAIATLSRSTVENARRGYPGYLSVRARLYADGWEAVARERGE